ncbi:MAG: hypothetical protein V4668_00845 [Patescibacteria group bacterium]
MTTVPNPFRIIDDVLMDYVFNPLSWWCEIHINRDAVHLGTICVYLGSVLVIVSLFIQDGFVNGFFGVALCVVSCRRRQFARRCWESDTKTGKNRLREFKWIMRSALLSMAVILSASLLVTNFSLINVSSGAVHFMYFFMIMFVVGMWLVTVLPEYFDATDTMPPKQVQTKTLHQI